MTKEEVIKNFNIKNGEKALLENFLNDLSKANKQTNLVGWSTMLNPWDRHICDSIQLSTIIKKKESPILDMGTGAGFPGLVLAIMGYEKTSLVDSNGKKINFINNVCKKLDIKTNVFFRTFTFLNIQRKNEKCINIS